MNLTDRSSRNGKQNLSASIITALKDRIIRWEYLPGHRLTEEELCQEFGVSRSPVREALRALTTNGFIEKMVHRSYTVRQLDIREIMDLYELRLALELFVVERLAQKGIAPESLGQLGSFWRAVLENEAPSDEKLAGMDRNFHEGLASAHGNKALALQLQDINERLSVFRVIDFSAPERLESTARQHLEILSRIAARHTSGARTAMEINIKESCDNVHTAITAALSRAYLRQVDRRE